MDKKERTRKTGDSIQNENKDEKSRDHKLHDFLMGPGVVILSSDWCLLSPLRSSP